MIDNNHFTSPTSRAIIVAAKHTQCFISSSLISKYHVYSPSETWLSSSRTTEHYGKIPDRQNTYATQILSADFHLFNGANDVNDYLVGATAHPCWICRRLLYYPISFMEICLCSRMAKRLYLRLFNPRASAEPH